MKRVKHGGGKIFTFMHGMLVGAAQNSTQGIGVTVTMQSDSALLTHLQYTAEYMT